METHTTRAHNLLLDTFCSDQSLFARLGDGSEMSLARACVCLGGVLNVKCWVHVSNLLGAAWFGLRVSRAVVCYYQWRVSHLWFIRCHSGDGAGALKHHYSIKRDPHFLCPSYTSLFLEEKRKCSDAEQRLWPQVMIRVRREQAVNIRISLHEWIYTTCKNDETTGFLQFLVHFNGSIHQMYSGTSTWYSW